MIKFIKEIFSIENLKRTIIYSSLADPNISTSEFIHLSNILRDMDDKDINDIDKEVNIEKVA